MCPSNYNPADFYIKTLAIEPANKEKCQKRVQVNMLLILEIVTELIINSFKFIAEHM